MLRELISFIAVNLPQPPTRTMLIKLVYLVEREYRKHGKSLGVVFKLYFYGPYSMEVVETIGTLVTERVLIEGKQVSGDGEREYYVYYPTYKAVKLAEKFEEEHPELVFSKTCFVISYGSMTVDELVEYVLSLPEVEKAKFLEIINL